MRLPNAILCWMTIAVAASAGSAVRAADVYGTVMLANENGVSTGQDLSRTVIYLEGHPALTGQPQGDGPQPQIVQRGKAFVPDLLVVAQGTSVEFPNWDPFSHNVFSRSRAAQFDLDRYEQGQSKSYTFNNAGVVQIFCNIHPQMKAVVLVVPNGYFARANGQGRYVLRDVPPGQYVLTAWRERAAETRQDITVPSEGLRDVALILPAGMTRDVSESSVVRQRPSGGVERGLGVKRERLNLPVVGGAHPAPGR